MLLFFSAFKRTVIFLNFAKPLINRALPVPQGHFPPCPPAVAPSILHRTPCHPKGHQPPTSDATSSSPQPCPALDCPQRDAQCLGLPWCPPAGLILADAIGWLLDAWPDRTRGESPLHPGTCHLRNISTRQKSKDKLSLASTRTFQPSPSAQDILKF